MCGIIGIVGSENAHMISETCFTNLVNKLTHRGPDGLGLFFHTLFYFGHRRLKITDLTDHGKQPMSDHSHTVYITYNGEIFNFLELKAELKQKGHSFYSSSDTEVILAAYKEWGIKCVERFNGMFAFGLFDITTKELYLVRDRLGIKPLYYSIINGLLVFSSELKGIINYPGFNKQINYRAVSCYLSYRHVLGSETMFANVYQLEPGHMANFRDGELTVSKYWNIDLSKKVEPVDKFSLELFKELILDAITISLSGDVEVGALLSGGIDSSIILSSSSQCGKLPVQSFTATYKEKEYDETYYSTLVARMFNSKNTLITISSKDYLANFREYIRYKDQPAGMHNEIATYLLAKEVKKNVSVVLSGEGADEVFSGYGRIFRSPYDYKRYKVISRLPRSLAKSIKKFLHIKSEEKIFSFFDYFMSCYSYFPLEEKLKIFNDRMKEAIDRDKYSETEIQECFGECINRDPYDQLNYFFVKIHLPGLLSMMDATTMASGLELRVPFLDHRIVEKSFTIPHEQKIAWKSSLHHCLSSFLPVDYFSERCDRPKNILKNLFRNELPDQVINRRKMGFPAPLNEWFANDLKECVQQDILSADAKINCMFDINKLKEWIKEKEQKKDKMLGRQLLMILTLEYWLQEYFE